MAGSLKRGMDAGAIKDADAEVFETVEVMSPTSTRARIRR